MSLPKLVVHEDESYKRIFEPQGVDNDNDIRVVLVGTISKFDQRDVFIAAADRQIAYVSVAKIRSANDDEIALLTEAGVDPTLFKV